MDMTRTPDGLRAGATPLGRSASRAPDTPNIRASDGPFRSASAAPTASPLSARAAAKVGRDGALSYAPFAAGDGHDRPNPSEAVGEAVLLVRHLLEQARAGVVGDVLVGSNLSHRISRLPRPPGLRRLLGATRLGTVEGSVTSGTSH